MSRTAEKSPPGSGRSRWSVLFLLLILAGGASLARWEVIRADRQRRTELTEEAIRTAESLNPRLIAELADSESSPDAPAYRRLKGYLEILRGAIPGSRFVYLLGQGENGEIFFLADSEDPDSPDHSPPGQAYPEASPELRRIFEDGRPAAEGPLADRWGTWVSGLAPVADPRTGRVEAVLGVDIEAGDWNRDLARAALPAILLTLVLSGLLLAGAVILARRERRAGDGLGRPHWLEPGWAAAFGLTLTVFAAFAAQRLDNRGRSRLFRQLADAKTALIADGIRDLRNYELEALTRFFEASEEVTGEEFGHFIRALTGYPIILSWQWAPSLPPGEMDASRVPGEDRPNRYPILYAEPPERRGSLLGRDQGADPAGRAAIAEAEASGRATAAVLPAPGGDPDGEMGLLVFRPFYRPGESEPEGFLSVELWPAALLPAGEATHFEISFARPGGRFELLASSCPGDPLPEPDTAAGRFLAAFGGVFRLEVHPGPGFFPGFRFRAGAAAGLTGLLVTAGLVILVAAPARVRERLEREVARRTAELRKSRDSYLQLADQTGTYTWEVDASGLYTYVSPVAERVIGYRPEELVGRKHFYDIHPEAGREEFREAAFAVFRRQERFTNLENPIRARDGRTVWVLTSGYPFFDPAGNLLGYRGGDTDISEPKRAAAERERLLAEAEEGRRVLLSVLEDEKRQAAERARLEDQVRQKQKLETVGRLAGGVAHEFNNMLSVILGFSELALRKAGADPLLRDDLEEIHRAALRSADITSRLLAFARKQVVSPRTVDLNENVERSLKMLRRLIGEEVELAWRPGTGLPPVRLDPGQVDQVLANLCINARDAFEGTGRIEIETGQVSRTAGDRTDDPEFVPGDYLTLSVSDNGRGMDRETRERIFEPFFTTKGVGEGSGLGLAVVYGIVRQNRGFIEVESEPGEGTTFKIYLPLTDQEQKETGDTAPDSAEPSRGGETILAVEDEPANLRLLERMLKTLGYKVLAAAGPEEALRLAETRPGGVDLLLTDVIMPKMNGRELADRLSALYPGLKCVFISGYTSEVIGRHGVLEEGVNFLEKPILLKPLADALREALG